MMDEPAINRAIGSMDIARSRMFTTLFDGIARQSADGLWFKRLAEEKGFKQAVRRRDEGAPIAQGVSKPFYRF